MKIPVGLWTVIATGSCAFIPAASASLITYAGALVDDAGAEITDWQTAGTPKTLDPDGDNIYGTDSLLFYRVQGPQAGDYVSFAGSQSQVGPFAGYATVDAPGGASDIQVRTTTSGSQAAGVPQDMFNFTINAGVPAGFRVGVVVDGLNGVQFTGADLTLVQTVGGSASANVSFGANANNTIDMYFFDVVGAIPGEQYTIRGLTGAGGFATHQIVTWDTLSVVPEPASFALVLLGGCCIFRRLKGR